MKACSTKSVNRGKKSSIMRYSCFSVLPLILLLFTVGSPQSGWALQHHSLLPEEQAAQQADSHENQTGLTDSHQAEQKAVQEHSAEATSAEKPGDVLQGSPAPEPSHALPQPPSAAQGQTQHAAPAPVPPSHEPSKEMPSLHKPGTEGPIPSPAHEEGAEALHEHGVAGEHVELPKISPTPGVTFVETTINLMDYELHQRTFGWRPNDLVIGRITDNVRNYQLGVLEAVRFTAQRLKVSFTRMGDADSYDKDLEQAVNLLMNRATLFWFPSAETSYGEAIDHLKIFLEKLKTGNQSFYYRTDNLLALCASYKDLLGNVNKSLIVSTYADGTPVSWFDCDDYFYYAKGIAHVMYEIFRVVRVGFESQLATIDGVDIMDEIVHELHRVESMDPWIILDSDLDGLFANHRANLNAPLSEVAHILGVLIQLGNQLRF